MDVMEGGKLTTTIISNIIYEYHTLTQTYIMLFECHSKSHTNICVNLQSGRNIGWHSRGGNAEISISDRARSMCTVMGLLCG